MAGFRRQAGGRRGFQERVGCKSSRPGGCDPRSGPRSRPPSPRRAPGALQLLPQTKWTTGRGGAARHAALPAAARGAKAPCIVLGAGRRGVGGGHPKATLLRVPAELPGALASCPALFCSSQEEASCNGTKRARGRHALRASPPTAPAPPCEVAGPPGTPPLPAWAKQGHGTLPRASSPAAPRRPRGAEGEEAGRGAKPRSQRHVPGLLSSCSDFMAGSEPGREAGGESQGWGSPGLASSSPRHGTEVRRALPVPGI